jgi:hypothetical protein
MSLLATLNLLKRKPAQDYSTPSTPPSAKRLKSSGGLSDVPDSLAPAPRTPSKIDSRIITPINQETPEKPKVENPSNLKSPQKYHDPALLSPLTKKDNKESKKLRKNLSREFVVKTLILEESPKKDPQRIRNGEIPQNDKGCFEVPSTTRDGSRVWAVHNESLYPVKAKGECSEDLVALKGPDLKTLMEEKRPEGKKFKDHLLGRLEPQEKKSESSCNKALLTGEL